MDSTKITLLDGTVLQLELIGRVIRLQAKNWRFVTFQYWPVEFVTIQQSVSRITPDISMRLLLLSFSVILVLLTLGGIAIFFETSAELRASWQYITGAVIYAAALSACSVIVIRLVSMWRKVHPTIVLVFSGQNTGSLIFQFQFPKEEDTSTIAFLDKIELIRSSPTDLTYNDVVHPFQFVSRSQAHGLSEIPAHAILVSILFGLVSMIAVSLLVQGVGSEHFKTMAGIAGFISGVVISIANYIWVYVRRALPLLVTYSCRRAYREIRALNPNRAREILENSDGAIDSIDGFRLMILADLMLADVSHAMSQISRFYGKNRDVADEQLEIIRTYQPVLSRLASRMEVGRKEQHSYSGWQDELWK
ncbi:MAG: hypothetical protein GC168_14010 [Candidatus Hydrogenedens sp.]|nr:hypothetical protein [Candidatus Hydrogenedens sp.]